MTVIFTRHGPLLYGILCVLYNTCCVTMSRVNVILSGDHTFTQAANNHNCKLVGMDRIGEISENHKHNVIKGMIKHSMAWIGAHEESVWIQFVGCYKGTINHANKGFDLSETTITSCLSHCGNRSFFLTHDHCFCNQNEVKYVGCSAVKCQHSSDLLCGTRDSGMFFPGRQCMCHYDTVIYEQPIHGAGDCLLSTYHQNLPSPTYSAVQCNQTHLSICQQFHGGTLPEFLKTESPWYQSLVNCYNINYHILGTRWLPFRLVTGSYWAGQFSVTNIRWGIINSNGTTRGCIAATETMEGKVNLIRLPCDTRIPALCFPVNKTVSDVIVKTDIYTTLQSNTVQINVTEQSTLAPTNISKALNQSNPDNDGVTSRVIIVTVVGLAFLIISLLVTVFLFVKRRKIRRKNMVKGSSSGQYMQPAAGETKIPSSQRPAEIAQCVGTSDNVYDELNDFRRDRILPSHDMYDHTFTGEMYGHLNAGNYQYADSDYDHTFSGETDGTYRHLGTTNKHQTVNNDYDHVFGGVAEQSAPQTNTNTDGNERPHTLDVCKNDFSDVTPVYAQVIKRHLREPISDGQ